MRSKVYSLRGAGCTGVEETGYRNGRQIQRSLDELGNTELIRIVKTTHQLFLCFSCFPRLAAFPNHFVPSFLYVLHRSASSQGAVGGRIESRAHDYRLPQSAYLLPPPPPNNREDGITYFEVSNDEIPRDIWLQLLDADSFSVL